MVAVLSSRFQVWSLSSPAMRHDHDPHPAELRSAWTLRLRSGQALEGGRPYTSVHCPITPSRTPFSLPRSNHATFCPNHVLVPLSLYFLVAAAKWCVPSREATGVSPNLPSRSESQPPLKGAARIT